jgi:hypothetical protein
MSSSPTLWRRAEGSIHGVEPDTWVLYRETLLNGLQKLSGIHPDSETESPNWEAFPFHPWADIIISALEWIEKGAGQMPDSDVKAFLVRMPVEEHQTLRIMSATTGRSMNDLVVRAVHEFLAGIGRDDEFEAASAKVGERYRSVLDKLGHM